MTLENFGDENPRQRKVDFDPAEVEDLMIPAAAAMLGISRWLLYDLVNRGKAHTKEVSIGNRRFLAIAPSEIRRLRRWLQKRNGRKSLIERLAAKKGIAKASARRWVERYENQGLEFEQILQRIKKIL